MSVKVIFDKIEKFSGALSLCLVFALAGLTFLNNQLNFDIPASTKVRDAAGFAEPFAEVKKLDLREGAKDFAATYTSPAPSVGFHISEPEQVSYLEPEPGYNVKRYMGYGGRFLYAHSSLAFSPLKWLYKGNTFTATIDGATSTYVVSARYVFAKSSDLDGAGNNERRTRIYSGRDESNARHSLALMTCGNGSNDDGNYRLVLFADRV